MNTSLCSISFYFKFFLTFFFSSSSSAIFSDFSLSYFYSFKVSFSCDSFISLYRFSSPSNLFSLHSWVTISFLSSVSTFWRFSRSLFYFLLSFLNSFVWSRSCCISFSSLIILSPSVVRLDFSYISWTVCSSFLNSSRRVSMAFSCCLWSWLISSSYSFYVRFLRNFRSPYWAFS